MVQRKAASEQNDGACEGERDGERGGWRRAVGRCDHWPDTASATSTVAAGGQTRSRVGRHAAAAVSRSCSRGRRGYNRVRVSGTV